MTDKEIKISKITYKSLIRAFRLSDDISKAMMGK